MRSNIDYDGSMKGRVAATGETGETGETGTRMIESTECFKSVKSGADVRYFQRRRLRMDSMRAGHKQALVGWRPVIADTP